VSILLGHQSVRITEKHYSPWVAARQEQRELDVKRTWDTDLVALPETKGDTRGTRKSGASELMANKAVWNGGGGGSRTIQGIDNA